MLTKDRKTAYYASRISDNISETPEGYLICHNVPIARTGVQEYLGQELGLNDKYDQYVKVYREAEDVFDPVAMASFEGKPLADEHPDPKIDVNNINMYGKGHAQNIRRSTDEPDLLLADVIVQDPLVIEKIKSGLKRDISSGYDCYYVPYKDGYRQIEIRGNHIALVTKGRAGSRVSIKDNKVERKGKMAKKNILAAMFKAFARDAEPDEVAEALDAINNATEEKSTPPSTPEVEVKKPAEDEDPLADLAKRIDEMENRLNKLYSAEKEEGHENLDADPEEEDVEEKIDEEEITEDSEDEEEIKEEKVVTSKDSFINLKKAIAKIRNPQDRKRVTDAFYGMNKSSEVYNRINKISNKASSQRMSKDSESTNLEDLGKMIAAKFNPHYKENK